MYQTGPAAPPSYEALVPAARVGIVPSSQAEEDQQIALAIQESLRIAGSAAPPSGPPQYPAAAQFAGAPNPYVQPTPTIDSQLHWFAAPAGTAFVRDLLAACSRRFPALAVRMFLTPHGLMRLYMGANTFVVFPHDFPDGNVTLTCPPFTHAAGSLTAQAAENLVQRLPPDLR